MELVGETPDYSIVIDYAHNAVSLETILKTLKKYSPKRIVCLFGCGGNRPKMRRFEMGEISGKYADFLGVECDKVTVFIGKNMYHNITNKKLRRDYYDHHQGYQVHRR